MSATEPAPPEIVRFLLDHPPFDALGADRVQGVADAVELEEHPAGTTIISQGADPVAHLRVVRSGTIEIVYDGTVLDLLGEGELFGHASMLSGLPTGFEARAAEDVTCYRIHAEVARSLLSDPAGLRFVARSLLERPGGRAAADDVDARDPTHEPVGALLRGPPVVCGPQTPIRDVVEGMSSGGATCAVVDLGDGTLGIVTDRDLRTRVLAAGLAGDARPAPRCRRQRTPAGRSVSGATSCSRCWTGGFDTSLLCRRRERSSA